MNKTTKKNMTCPNAHSCAKACFAGEQHLEMDECNKGFKCPIDESTIKCVTTKEQQHDSVQRSPAV